MSETTDSTPPAHRPDASASVEALVSAASLGPLVESVDTLLNSVARLAQTSEEMQSALNRRTTVDRAVGILMGRLRCTPETALDLLWAYARNTGTHLPDIAAEIVAHAADPAGAAPSAPLDREGGPGSGPKESPPAD
jgi:AmiR/NasT family two-component response regulator